MAYKNKKDQSVNAKKHYLANLDKIKIRSKVYNKFVTKRNKEYIAKYLEVHPCIDCGFTDIRALDFDHVKDIKLACISAMVKRCSLKTLTKEINKCEVRCANCHRIITSIRRIAMC